jgi:ribulose-phosphate 3-epimerase
MHNSFWIAPSILNADQNKLEDEIKRIENAADLLHLDIMDNKFVPNFTYDLNRAKELVASTYLKVDAHLMIEDPEQYAPKYAQIGCYSTTFHLEAASDPIKIIREIKEEGSKVGIAIKPNTELSALLPFIELIDMALIMTVEPGFGGQSYISAMESKVTFLREYLEHNQLTKVRIEVDGGINLETIVQAKTAGADTFVAGSAVYRDPSPANAINALRLLL